MKKLLLFFTLFFSTSVIFAQGLNQPSIFNTQCDTSNDGFEMFYLQEISFEILAGLNSNDYVVTHHLTQADAANGINPLPSAYINAVNPQLIFVRVVNTVTSQVQITTYNLNVNPIPVSTPQSLAGCGTNGLACFDLTTIISNITFGNPSLLVTFYVINGDANAGANPIANVNAYCTFASPQTIYYRNENASTGCYSIGTVFLTSNTCQQAGQPMNLSQCIDNGPACFDLALNNSNIMGSLNPSDYTITYHNTQADAQNDFNTLTSPYCITNGSQVIFARLENNATQNFQIFTFSIISQTVSTNTIILANMNQCDDNNDGAVIFNLTNIQAQITSSNPLAYYLNAQDANAQINAIANPSAFSVGAQSTITNISVRETVVNSCDLLYTFQVRAFANCNLASSCSLANSLCNALGSPFVNSINANAINEAGASYGCLGSHPNPTWFYLPISSAGNINLQINQINMAGMGIDVDYIVYGPYATPVTPCSGQLTSNFIVSCSYSANAIEYPVIPNAQPGQFYLIMVTNYSNQAGNITITELSNTQGAINCSGIRMNAFLDGNNNGSQDAGEQNFPLGQFHYELNNNGNVHNITSPSGVYNIYDINAANSYDISYSIDPSYTASYGISTPSYDNVSAVLGTGMQTYNFPITVTQVYNDLAVTIVPIQQPRPGFTYQNKIVYANLGNQTIASGTLTFNKAALVTITANTQAGTTPITNGFIYNFSNLLPFETRIITVTMQVPTIPTVTIGNYLTNSASITPLTGDVVPGNNSSIATQMISGAYDPNDKMESHGEQILFSSFTSNDYLYYTIRFENTGNASAINVRVNDVLDAKLDENSVEIINASHNYIMDRVGNNLTWRFDNIQLPAVSQNPAAGKGYVMFKVKPKPGYAIGDIIPNTASIYFDYNPAIITNTFQTEFAAQLAVDQFENGNFVFYPNPTNGIVTISLKNNTNSISSIVVYDVIGKVIMTKKPSNTMATETIDLSSATSGIYFLEVTTDNNLKVVKKLVVK